MKHYYRRLHDGDNLTDGAHVGVELLDLQHQVLVECLGDVPADGEEGGGDGDREQEDVERLRQTTKLKHFVKSITDQILSNYSTSRQSNKDKLYSINLTEFPYIRKRSGLL